MLTSNLHLLCIPSVSDLLTHSVPTLYEEALGESGKESSLLTERKNILYAT